MKKSKKLVGLIVGILSLVGIVAVGCSDKGSSSKKPTPQPTTQGEWGVYYYDYNGSEYLLSLADGNRVTVIMGNTVVNGTYSRKDSDISVTHKTDGVGELTAKINADDSVVTLTYNNVPMQFLRRVIYNVTFNTDNGSAVDSVEVLNGKSFGKPSDPVRAGYTFLGWYKDSEYNTPFIFESDIISADITLYAQWGQSALGENVYTIKFDLGGYEGAVNPQPKQTVGGKVYGLDEPTRSGYTFMGWWYSVTGKADELTYRVDADTVYTESTTLYAVWQGAREGNKLLAPMVSIEGNRVSWDPVANAVSYRLSVVDSDGYTQFSRDYTTTSAELTISTPGSYTVSVTAISASGTGNNSDPTLRTYNYNALSRVSLFTVINSDTLLWNGVDHAERYLIDVDCGNPDHDHNPFDNGESTYFNFSNCEMQATGIKMTVTAIASGYTSSVSDTYVINKNLDAITGLRYDEQMQTVAWQAVPNATNYEITLVCDTLEHSHLKLDLGTKTSYCIKECIVPEGGINVIVTARTKGYNSPAPATLIISAAQKSAPATPCNLRITETILHWSEVADADKYTVKIGDRTFESTTNSLDLSALSVNWANGADYNISVRAEKGDATSAWSDVADARYYAMYSTLAYNRNTVSWRHVIGAKAYDVRVNGDNESIVKVENGANYARIKLSQSGDNLVEVRYYTDDVTSDWAPITVKAYAVTLDTRGGAAMQGVATTQYYAIGDEVSLPIGDAITKTGYTLGDWYNTPNCAEGNGARYTDKLYGTPSDIMLYASWIPETYTITLDYNEGGTGITETTVTFGKPFTWPTPDTVADATMVFGGWCANMSGTAASYTDELGNSLANWSIADDVTVYAQWKQVFAYEKHQGGSAGFYYELQKSDIAREIDTVTVPGFHKAAGDTVAYPVAQIASNAFDSCTNVKVINLPNTLDTIPTGMFKSNKTIREINVYTVEGVSNNKYWSNNGVLFYNNATAGTVDLWAMPRAKTGVYTLPNSVTTIPTEGFYHSTLSEIRIPSNVTYIAYHAFYYSEIPTVTFMPTAAEDSAKTLRIEEAVFDYSSQLETVTLPDRKFALWDPEVNKEIKDFDYGTQVFKNCNGLTTINVHPSNNDYQSIEGVLCTKGSQATILYVPKNRTGRYTIPVGVVAIGDHAFTSSSIEEVVIPNWVKSIGDYAFAGFRTFDGNGKLKTYINGCSTLKKVTFAGGEGVATRLTIGKNAFGNESSTNYACRNLATIEFQEGSNVAEIGEYAFANCPITNITFPVSLEEIKDNAFYNCTSLETLTYAANGKSVKIGNNVFAKCSKLTTIVLPANITQFDDGVFSECDSLSTIEVDPNNPVLKSVDGVLFSKDGKELKFFPTGKDGNYEIPAEVEKIGAGAFGGAVRDDNNRILARSNIESIVIGKNVTYIGARAFANCQNLISVTFEAGGTKELVIGSSAFNSCINLETFRLPDRVKKIPDRMLYRALKLTEIYIPNGVTEIGDFAFSVISTVSTINGVLPQPKIAKITVPASVETIGLGVFYNTGVGEIEFVEQGRTKPLVFETADAAITASSGAIYWTDNYYAMDIEKGGSPLFYYCSALSTINLPNGITEIPGYAFRSCESLVSIRIPGTVTKIGEAAFGYCYSLKNVVFEERSVTAEDPTKKLPLEFGEGFKKTTGSNSYAIYGVFSCCTALEQITLPEGLTRIPAYTFANCSSLKTVHIPASVQNGEYVPGETQLTAIGALAFGSTTLATGQYGSAAPDMVIETITFAAGGTGEFSLAEQVFYNNKKLTSITLPATLADSYIAEFVPTTSSISLGFVNGKVSGVRTGIEYSANNGEKRIYMNGSFDGCPNLANINVAAGGKNYMSIDGVLYGGGGTELAYVPIAHENDIVVPGNVTLVRNFAAYGNTKVKKLTFEEPEEGTGNNASTQAGLDIGKNGFRYSTYSTGPFKNTKLTEVIFPKRLTSIDNDAFMSCAELTTVTIPENTDRMARVGDSAFESDAKLTSIYIPDSVTEIGERAFFGTSALTTVTINETSALGKLGDQAFNSSGIMSIYLPPANPFEMGKEVFAKCVDLATARIPETITSFDGLFSGSTSLYMLDIYKVSGGGTTSSDGSFINDNGAIYIDNGKTLSYYPASKTDKEYTVRPGTELIAAYAFNGNLSLEKLIIPNTVSQIDDKALWAMQSLKQVVFEKDDVMHYVLLTDEEKKDYKGDRYTKNGDEYIFDQSGDYKLLSKASKLVLGSVDNTSVTSVSVAGSVFAYCVNLERVDFPARLEKIAAFSFYYCKKLTTVTFDAGCKLGEISKGLFIETALEFGGTREQVDEDPTHDFELPALISSFATATSTEKNPFGNVKKLVIPSGVSNVGNYAFYYSNLEEVVFTGTGDLTLGTYVFEGCSNLTTVVLPNATKTIPNYAFRYCTSLVWVSTTAPTGPVTDGTVTIPNKVTELGTSAFEGCTGLVNVYLPSSSTFTKINGSAFNKCYNIEKITSNAERDYDLYLSSNVVNIGAGAFAGTKITSAYIPGSITTLSACFGSSQTTDPNGTSAGNIVLCSELRKVVFDQTTCALTTLPSNLFLQLAALEEVQLPTTKMTTIGAGAFAHSGIKRITIPANITTINKAAFAYCPNLEYVGFTSSSAALTLTAGTYQSYASTTWSNSYSNVGVFAASGTNNGRADAKAAAEADNATQAVKDAYAKNFKIDMSGRKITATNKWTFNALTNLDVVLSTETTTISTLTFQDAELESITVPAKTTTIQIAAFAKSKIKGIDFAAATTAVTIAAGTTTTTDTTLGAFAFCSELTKVDMSKRNITTIPNYAFYGSEALNDVKWSVKTAATETAPMVTNTATIGNYAFRSAFAPNLTILELPEGVTSIGTWAFNDTPFTSVTFPSTLTMIGERSFSLYTARDEYSGLTGAVTIPGKVATIGNYAFADAPITELTFATYKDSKNADVTSIKTISQGAFYGTNIAEITIPASLETLGNTAFYNTALLTEVTFEGGSKLKTIGESAFEGSAITGVEIPASVTEIKKNAFAYNTDFVSVEFAEGSKLTTIGENAFRGTALTSVLIPKSVTSIGYAAFYEMKNDADERTLISVEFETGSKITSFSEWAFGNNSNLAQLTLPNSLTSISNYAFRGAAALKTVEIPNAVTTIGSYAFAYSGLTSVTFEKTDDGKTAITTLNKAAFGYTDLTAFEIPESVTALNSNPFMGCEKLTAVTIGAAGEPTTQADDGEEEPTDNFVIDGYAIYNSDKTVLLVYLAGAPENTAFTLDAHTVEIADYAFYGSKFKGTLNSTNANFTVGVSAFEGTGITAVTLGENATIYEDAFSGCTSLATVTLGKSANIGAFAFEGCTSLTAVTVPEQTVVDFTSLYGSGIQDPSSVLAQDTSVVYNGMAVTDLATLATFDLTKTVIIYADSKVATTDNQNNMIANSKYQNNTTIEYVVVAEGVERIGNNAFNGCTNLKGIILPSTLNWIGQYALKNTGLVSVVIPSNVETILYNAFEGNNELQTVTFAPGSKVKYFCYSSTSKPTATNSVNTFINCPKLTSVTLPDSMAAIPYQVFKGCTSLESITIPSTVSEIYASAFENCTKLKTVTFAKKSSATANDDASQTSADEYGIISIGNAAFKNTGFTSFVLPYTVTTLGNSVFENCKLASFTFGKRTDGSCDLTTIGSSVFKSNKINADDETYTGPTFTSISIPYSVTAIGANMFENGPLTTITFEKKADGSSDLTSIGASAFKNSALTSFTLPYTVTTIGANAFENCGALATFTFEKRADGSCDITTIGASAFKCNKLNDDDETYTGSTFTSISIPYSVTTIGANAFENGPLTTITFEKRADGSCDFAYTG
ncbi:MAG: leucine-rich repeat protein, partial [Clostridiales bacterium]|nr:leucine-rich repeat protein [Clostridiales bacterium]